LVLTLTEEIGVRNIRSIKKRLIL